MLKRRNTKLKSAQSKKAALFRNGRNQAVRIPKEFELPGKEVVVIKESNRLVLEPVPIKPSLIALLDSLKPIEESFPNVDETLLENDDVHF